MSARGLEVVDVTVAFGGLTALESVSLEVRPGEIVGIIGPNGAGKTTLFNVACGFIRPRRGHVRVDGRTLRQHRPDQLPRLGISRTLQSLGLWHGMSVLENVMAGATIQARAGFAAALFGLPRSSGDERALAARARMALGELGSGRRRPAPGHAAVRRAEAGRAGPGARQRAEPAAAG